MSDISVSMVSSCRWS